MRVLIATDAWPPQVNGVVRTLTSLARSAGKLGVTVEFLSPDGFRSVPVPTYPGLRLAIPSRRKIARRIEQAKPDAIHVATEGPIGHYVRAYCRRNRQPFTTSYTTRFPEYISARVPIPESWTYAALRQFQGAAAVTMVATPSLMNLGRAASQIWARGHGASTPICFAPTALLKSDLPARFLFAWGGSQSRKTSTRSFFAGPARNKSRDRQGPDGARAKAPLPKGQISRATGKRHAGGASRRRKTSSCFRAAPTPSASCNSKRWRAAFRSPRSR